MNKTKQVLLTIVGIVLLVLITVGVTYSFIMYTQPGEKENTIYTGGGLRFKYMEKDRSIKIADAMPMTNEVGTTQKDYVFDFTILGDITDASTVTYYVTARKDDISDNIDNIVNMYLTEVTKNTNVEVEQPVSKIAYQGIKKYSALEQYTDITNHTEKIIYADRVEAHTRNYKKDFRLRMWLDDSADFYSNDYNNKKFKVNINVYAYN